MFLGFSFQFTFFRIYNIIKKNQQDGRYKTLCRQYYKNSVIYQNFFNPKTSSYLAYIFAT